MPSNRDVLHVQPCDLWSLESCGALQMEMQGWVCDVGMPELVASLPGIDAALVQLITV